jgi:predicted protein tyrosine phosphatase
MPFIQNVALSDIHHGLHRDAGENSVLIRILDPDMEFLPTKKEFGEVYTYRFLDIDQWDIKQNPSWENKACTQKYADEIAGILQNALANNKNVIVHCFAGSSRSGAVCEVGIKIGFDEAFEGSEKWRHPNLLVKNMLYKSLNMPYNFNEKPNPDDWRNLIY